MTGPIKSRGIQISSNSSVICIGKETNLYKTLTNICLTRIKYHGNTALPNLHPEIIYEIVENEEKNTTIDTFKYSINFIVLK